jgi:hypothetical protein
MTNDEIRMTIEKASPKSETLPLGGFVIAVSNFIRHSDFGFRH